MSKVTSSQGLRGPQRYALKHPGRGWQSRPCFLEYNRHCNSFWQVVKVTNEEHFANFYGILSSKLHNLFQQNGRRGGRKQRIRCKLGVKVRHLMTLNVGEEVPITKQPCFVSYKHSKTAHNVYFNPSSNFLCPQHIKQKLGASGGLRIVPRAKKSYFIPSHLTHNSF